jgi:hypothetical protein
MEMLKPEFRKSTGNMTNSEIRKSIENFLNPQFRKSTGNMTNSEIRKYIGKF